MIKELKKIKEALEYIQDSTPNFNIEHKAKQAIAKLDGVIEKLNKCMIYEVSIQNKNTYEIDICEELAKQDL